MQSYPGQARAEEKEKELTRLRAKQERANDEQAELDALRAARAQAQYIKDMRRKDQVAIGSMLHTHAHLLGLNQHTAPSPCPTHQFGISGY